jgi:hypothetical protein
VYTAPNPRTAAGVVLPGTKKVMPTMLLPIGENNRSGVNVRKMSL